MQKPYLAVANGTLKVSQLKKGMKIRLSETVATVADLKWRNGTDGQEPYLISFNGRLAAALEISFTDHELILAHLDEDVILAI